MLDLLLPKDPSLTVLYSLIIFLAFETLYLVLLYPFIVLFKWADDHAKFLKFCLDDVISFCLGVTCVAGWRCIWNTTTVYFLSDHPQVACWTGHLVAYVVLSATLVSNSILSRGCKLDCVAGHGDVVYMDGTIQKIRLHCFGQEDKV